jgi:glutamate/tyrosine decarboxylase-like PLP-dependent enzyme
MTILVTPKSIDNYLDDTFATPPLLARAPKSTFPEHEQEPREVYQLVRDELMLDGVARMNLATFCTTWVEPEVRQLMDDSLDKNIVDKDEYPQTAELETRCVRMLADLFHSPSPQFTIGTSTTGSSEAAMLGALLPSGAGDYNEKPLGMTRANPTSSAARFRCAGRNLVAISMSRRGRFP